MNKNGFLLFVCFLFGVSINNVFGQANDHENARTPENLAKADTFILVSATKIDSVLSKKVYAYFLDFRQEKNTFFKNAEKNKELKEQAETKLKQLDLKLQNHLKEVLTETQYNKYIDDIAYYEKNLIKTEH